MLRILENMEEGTFEESIRRVEEQGISQTQLARNDFMLFFALLSESEKKWWRRMIEERNQESGGWDWFLDRLTFDFKK